TPLRTPPLYTLSLHDALPIWPGSYRFVVNATTGDGNWVEAGAPWSFRVLPAWHQTAWFRGMVVLLIGGVGGLGVSLVQRRRHLRSEEHTSELQSRENLVCRLL